MSNLFAIDIGNTRTKWGVHDGRGWIEQDAVETGQQTSVIEQIKDKKTFNIINKIYISSVADKNITAKLIQQLENTGAEMKSVHARKQQCGVTNHYDTPEQLGSDRWCALIAAHQLHQGHAIVIMAGTAMTIDALTADGKFLGGIIVPGLSLMQDALRNRTAMLRPGAGAYKPFPANTQDAIHSGIISASLGAIAQMRCAMQSAGYAKPTYIIGGGGADWLVPHLNEPVIRVDNLVLEGLLHIAKSESMGMI
ncbi:MAG: type III pantothenate kinase [Burkholderiales bacterium]